MPENVLFWVTNNTNITKQPQPHTRTAIEIGVHVFLAPNQVVVAHSEAIPPRSRALGDFRLWVTPTNNAKCGRLGAKVRREDQNNYVMPRKMLPETNTNINTLRSVGVLVR